MKKTKAIFLIKKTKALTTKKTITIEDFARKNIDKILIIINNATNLGGL